MSNVRKATGEKRERVSDVSKRREQSTWRSDGSGPREPAAGNGDGDPGGTYWYGDGRKKPRRDLTLDQKVIPLTRYGHESRRTGGGYTQEATAGG